MDAFKLRSGPVGAAGEGVLGTGFGVTVSDIIGTRSRSWLSPGWPSAASAVEDVGFRQLEEALRLEPHPES